MPHFVIEPFVGVGPIRFGMHKDAVSKAFRTVYHSFFKGNQKIRSDGIVYEGLIVHYDQLANVDYIEIVTPQYVERTLELFGKDVTDWSIRKFVQLLKEKSSNFSRDSYGFDFPDLGINLFNHDYGLSESGDDAKVECIGLSPPCRE